MLPERSGKQQQQQLSQKASTGQTITVGDKGALREQRISGVAGLFNLVESLSQRFALCSEQPRCYLSVAANSGCSNSARKGQWTRSKPVQSTRESSQGRRRTAPSSRPSSASPLPAASAHTPYHPPTHPPTSPHHTDHHVAAASPAAAPRTRWQTPRSRCSDSCRAPPRLALYPLPALA